MKAMSVTTQIKADAGSGYKCSKCGKKFYTKVIYKTPWWLPDVKSYAIDQCNMHIMTSANHKNAKAKWCW